MLHSHILVPEFSYILGQSPRKRITMHWNVVPTIFHAHHKCNHGWKTVRTTLWSFIVLQLRGQGPETLEIYGTYLSHCCSTFNDFSPRLGNNNTLQCSSDWFPRMVMYSLFMENCWNKISMQSCLSIVGKLFYNVWKIHETRIWEFNIYKIILFVNCILAPVGSNWNQNKFCISRYAFCSLELLQSPKKANQAFIYFNPKATERLIKGQNNFGIPFLSEV